MTQLHCLLCGTVAAPGRVDSPRFRDGAEARHRVATCACCGLVQLFPLMTPEEETAYYARDRQPKDIFGERAYQEILFRRSQPETRRRLDWLRGLVPPGPGVRLLDVGSGYDYFVAAACEAGYDGHGLEISDDRMALARQGRGSFHHTEADESFVAAHRASFDAVTSFHCIEHLRDPVGYVRRLGTLVKPGGVLLIEVPNGADEMGAIPEYARHLWQVCHYSYFDKARLELLFLRAGFAGCEVRGVQRYDLRHLLRWTDRRAPDLDDAAATGDTALLRRVEALYRQDRELRFTCDTLIAEVRP